MTDVNYPQPLSLKDDWGGWVVDHNIKPITTDLTNVELRKLPQDRTGQIAGSTLSYALQSSAPSITYGRSGQDIIAPVGYQQPTPDGSLPNPPSTPDLSINPIIKDIRKTCVSPGIVDSLHPISDDSCMMLSRTVGGGAHSNTAHDHNSFSAYAGENSASEATTKNLTNEYSKVSSVGGTYDLNNIKFTHNPPTSANQRTGNSIFEDNENASSHWEVNDKELHSYIDVEKYNDDVYWNDYDIWDIKRLYKENHGQSEYKDRKIWWDNLYNPYCHDMYEWLDTGLRSNESTMRMTCSYSVGDDSTINNSRKNYVSTISSASDLGVWDAYGGPDVRHPLSSILGNNYILPGICSNAG